MNELQVGGVAGEPEDQLIEEQNDRLIAELLRMPQRQVERVSASFLTQFREQRDVTADNRLQRCADRPEHRSRAHRHSANDAEGLDSAPPIDRERRRDPAVVDGRLLRLLPHAGWRPPR